MRLEAASPLEGPHVGLPDHGGAVPAVMQQGMTTGAAAQCGGTSGAAPEHEAFRAAARRLAGEQQATTVQQMLVEARAARTAADEAFERLSVCDAS